MTKYTFTISYDSVNLFRNIRSRLEENEYVVIEELRSTDPENQRADYQCIYEMDSDAALTFHLGMKNLKITREKTPEELKAIEEKTVRVSLPVDIFGPDDRP